ncbi:MAG: amino acid ABC transporter permease [Thermomicrobiales bacterium]|nr:amino acid ABC transporter permease [Thermomicrobiales bacterium]
MQTVIDNFGLLMRGLAVTLQLSALIIVIGTTIGVFGGLGLLYGPAIVRAILRGYVDIVRGTPLLVIIFLIFYGLPALNVDISGFGAAVIAFSLFAGAHVSEIIRGAVAAVPKGQTDAAKALGLTFWPRIGSIILPQALPIILPPWVNTAVEMVKGSSLVVLVSVSDLMFATVKVAERTGDPMPLYITAAAIYIVVNLAISRFGVWLERRISYGVPV